jgi:hypothetical protein
VVEIEKQHAATELVTGRADNGRAQSIERQHSVREPRNLVEVGLALQTLLVRLA